MANDAILHPRRAALAATLERAIPMPDEDKEARDEKHLLRRAEIKKAVER